MPQFNKSDVTNNINDENASSTPIELTESAASDAPSSSTATSNDVTYTKLSKLPKHIDEMKRSGNEFMENEKYLQAINQYSECIKLMPMHPVFYLNRATAYMRRNWFGDVYSALRDCQQALRLDPTYVKAHFRLARALYELGFVVEASECLDELKKRFPNDANNKQIQLLAQDIQSHMEVNNNNANDSVDEIHTEITFHCLCSGVVDQIKTGTAIAQALNSPKMNWSVLVDRI